MAAKPVEQGLMPSVLDRLIDPATEGAAWRSGIGIEALIRAVQRDLEELLNTRRGVIESADSFPELSRSIVAYGLPDLNSVAAASVAERESLGREIERIIGRFEPRLKQVKARMVPGDKHRPHTLAFTIDAKLTVEPAPEIAFETVLELTTGRAVVMEREVGE